MVLALLALDPGRVVGVDRLVDGIWGANLPGEPANALQVVVSRLRRALAPDQVVVSRPPGYLLAIDPERVDAVRFERLAAAGRAAIAAGDAERASGLLQAALDLWRGDALADFPGVPTARAAATRLEELRLAALEDRIEVDLGLGRQARVIGELQALVEREPLRERLYAQLMRALYATGRQADALGAYQRARAVLAERAGLDPGPELRRLEAHLLAQDPALAIAPELSAAAPRATRPGGPALREPDAAPPEPGAAADVAPRAPGATAAVAPSNLPAPLTSFVGREEEIAQVRKLLGRGRLVTLVGPGGAGKTRLALEAVTRLLAGGEVGRDGAWLVELASLRDPALLPGAVLDAVGRRRRGRRRGPAPAARAGQPPPAADPRQLRAPGGGGRQPGRDDPRRLPGSARAGDQPRGAARARRAAPAHAGAADAAGGPGRPGGAARLRRRPAVRGARPRGGPEPGAGRVPGAGDRRDLPTARRAAVRHRAGGGARQRPAGRRAGRAASRPIQAAHHRRADGAAAPTHTARGGRLELGAAD